MKEKKTDKKVLFRASLEKRLKDPEFRKGYDAVDAEIRLAVEIAEARTRPRTSPGAGGAVLDNQAKPAKPVFRRETRK